MRIQIKQVCEYGGHSVGQNGSVNLTLKASYSELPKSIELLQLLNNDIKVKAKVPGEKPILLGPFMIKDVNISGDGTSKIKLNGLNDFVELASLNHLSMNGSNDVKSFVVLYDGTVELEDGEEDE